MKVLIYDGECNMCSKFIRFVVYMNRDTSLYITDFNSTWTKENVELDSSVDSIIFLMNNSKYIYSNAILHLLAETNCLFKPILLLKLIPRTLRDWIYKLIAKNRRGISKSKACPIPSKKARGMFLS